MRAEDYYVGDVMSGRFHTRTKQMDAALLLYLFLSRSPALTFLFCLSSCRFWSTLFIHVLFRVDSAEVEEFYRQCDPGEIYHLKMCESL